MSAEEGDLVATDGTPDDTNERRSGLMIVMIPDHCDDGRKRKGEELIPVSQGRGDSMIGSGCGSHLQKRT
jgi:hypothetical protein